MNIIRATPVHADQLTQIAISAKRHWNYPEKWIELWLPALAISADYISEHETWMAVSVEEPVAFYSLKEHSVIARERQRPKQSPSKMWGLLRREVRPPRNDINSLWLDNLWVLSEYMGQGLGRELFQHALERSRARNASILKIEADPNAESFYEKMGARKVGEHQSEVDGQPRTLPIMEINL